MKRIITYVKKEAFFLGLSVLLPIAVLAFIYAGIGVYPGSETRTILASDAFYQYSHFFASLNNVLKGEQNIFYSWNASLGLNYWAFMAYYLGGIFGPLVVFFKNIDMPDFLYYLTLLKIGCMGGTFWVLARQTFSISRWGHVQLSISYALMSFVLAYSEIIMWMDAFIYLPLVILGIHRLMDKKKPILLFISYFLLFISNFYMAFMVGIFSFLYFFARLFSSSKPWLPKITMYGITSLLAGGAAMVIILPTLLDLSNNGEALSKIKHLKTSYTGPWDLVIKNMVGVYDSTKIESTAFIYIGLFALLFCLFFFITKKISWKKKLCFGLLLLFLAVSFYLEPLNLFWQGMHTPNMFNFRFSFLFSFLVLLLAGYGWEKAENEDFDQLVTIVLGLLAVFLAVWLITKNNEDYSYLSTLSFVLSLAFLTIYLLVFYFMQRYVRIRKWLNVLLLLTVCGEMGLNGLGMIEGVMVEWVYPNRSYYSEAYPDIQALVDQTKAENETFYRMENLNPVTANDSFNYGYSGVNMFSSIRNRHSSYFLNILGYRSLGTNLNIRYANNTLLMDALMGIKYNLSRTEISKFGYQKIGEDGKFQLYENEYTLPLGIWTDEGIFESGTAESQADLLKYLADTKGTFFTYEEMKLVSTKNVKQEKEKINQTSLVSYIPENWDEPMELNWTVSVPANKQAYVSIYPVNYRTFGSPSLKLEVNGVETTSAAAETGQYYSLGYYEEETQVDFKMTISGLKEEEEDLFQIVEPDVALLDTEQYMTSVEKIREKGVDLNVDGRHVSGKVELEEEQVLFTSIPYDGGWSVYIDGEKADLTVFKAALLAVTVPAGEHTVEFVFLPQGLVAGSILLLLCTGGFIAYIWIVRKKEKGLSGEKTKGHTE